MWLKYHSWYFKINWKFHHNNFEISIVVFMPNITANHAITCTNLHADCLSLVPSVFHLKNGRDTFPTVTVIWVSPRFGNPYSQNPSDMGFGNGDAQNAGMPAYHCDTAPCAVGCMYSMPCQLPLFTVFLPWGCYHYYYYYYYYLTWQEIVIAHLKKSLNQWVSRKLNVYSILFTNIKGR